jgi:hypothetical protein
MLGRAGLLLKQPAESLPLFTAGLSTVVQNTVRCDYMSVATISPTQAVVAWTDYDAGPAYAAVLTITGTSVAVGPALQVNANYCTSISVERLTATSVLVMHGTAGGVGYLAKLSISGNTLSYAYGMTLPTGYVGGLRTPQTVYRREDGSAAVSWIDTSGYGRVAICQDSGAALAINGTYGVTAAAIKYHSVLWLNETTVLVAHTSEVNVDLLVSQFSVSGVNVVPVGTTQLYAGSGVFYTSMCRLDDQKAMLFFYAGGYRVMQVTVSGTPSGSPSVSLITNGVGLGAPAWDSVSVFANFVTSPAGAASAQRVDAGIPPVVSTASPVKPLATYGQHLIDRLTNTTFISCYTVSNSEMHAQVITMNDPAAPVDPMEAPTALDATNVLSSSFQANWSAVTGATSYRLDVATTIDFQTGTFVSGYQDKTVSGTNDSVTSVTPDTVTYYYRVRTVGVNPTSGNSNIMTVSTGVVYNYYRVLIASNSSPGDNLLYMNELHMQGSVGGADIAPDSVTAKDYYDNSPTWSPANLVDYNAGTSWLTAYPCTWPEWVQFGWSVAKVIKQITMTANSGEAGGFLQRNRMPRDFDIQGSNNGTDWTTLQSYTSVTFADGETKAFTI